MAKAMSGMFRTHEQQHSWKPPPGPEVSREALTNALLETVRMVLEEQGPELQRLAPSSPVVCNRACESSDQTTSESFLPAPAPGPALALAAAPPKKKTSSSKGILGGPCSHCGTQDSPQWRRPLTKKVVLCNACGIYYSRHHSLPKRKKNVFGTPPMAAEDNGGSDRKDVVFSAGLSQATDTCSFDASAKTDPMLCDALPASLRQIRTKRESLSSGEHSGKAEPASAPAVAAVAHSAVSLGAASPATSCGSPMVSCAGGAGGVTAPPSTPKRRGDESDGPFAPLGSHGGYGEVHAEDSLAKRVMKRAATNAAANAAAAGFCAVPGAASAAATWRTVTTAPPGVQGAVAAPSMTVMEAMLQRSRISGACMPPTVFDDARVGSASAAAGELSADSDAGMLDVLRPALPIGSAEWAGSVTMRPRRESSPAAVGRSSCPGSPTTSRMKVAARSNAPASGRLSRRLLQQQLQP
uniref:GATA-type domain-containing protein n=1 Tax=Chlamydomonas euryale TaxID=1486919 RepID=A0A7R9V485_9CHLO|mmetsp:Transcript_14672/g.42957  ORF Transcript_14672/g.42957 Transcript_14672/m.42957 type:complete len:468 (+) Transcript_14672:428-1831(+)